MTLREKRDAVNAAIALIITLAAGQPDEIQSIADRTLRQLQALEKELYPPEETEEMTK